MNARIKLLRKQHNFSLDNLASRSGLTKSYLSKVERGLSTPSISTALAIANALEVDVGDLFAASTHDLISVVKKGESLRIGSNDDNKRIIDVLASGITDKAMQPFIISPPSNFEKGPQLHVHIGEEFLYVLEGELEIEFPEQIERLVQGDSIYFRAEIPHRIRCVGQKKSASALVVISEGKPISFTSKHWKSGKELGTGPS